MVVKEQNRRLLHKQDDYCRSFDLATTQHDYDFLYFRTPAVFLISFFFLKSLVE